MLLFLNTDHYEEGSAQPQHEPPPTVMEQWQLVIWSEVSASSAIQEATREGCGAGRWGALQRT